jgi:hypothetical protein
MRRLWRRRGIVSNDFVESIRADRFMLLMGKVVDSCQREGGNTVAPERQNARKRFIFQRFFACVLPFLIIRKGLTRLAAWPSVPNGIRRRMVSSP